MFERYTEKARRVIFFARYEAAQFGSPFIETEHLLLGLLREIPEHLGRLIPKIDSELLRKEIKAGNQGQLETFTSVDLPLSDESKRALAYAAEESEWLGHRHIGSEHLVLGLLREEECYGARILRQHGASLSHIRASIGQGLSNPAKRVPSLTRVQTKYTVEIHGSTWDLRYVKETAIKLKRFAWRKQTFSGFDIAVRLSDGASSFDLNLARDESAFRVLRGGWKEAQCNICYWELKVCDDIERGTGFTNGRDWLCCECFEKFMGDFTPTSSNYSDIT